MSAISKRTAKQKHSKPDGAKAFHIVSEMDETILGLRGMAAATKLIAEAADEEPMQLALMGVARTMEQHIEKLYAAHGAAFRLTWGYAYPDQVPQAEPASEQA